MIVTVNKEAIDVPEQARLSDVIAQLKLPETKGVALALNEQIVPKSAWETTELSEGDQVILIGAVAGG